MEISGFVNVLNFNDMKKIAIVTLFAIGSVLIIQPLSAAKIKAVKVGSKINVSIDGKFFTSYIFSSDEKHPYFFPVNGPLSGGSNTSIGSNPWPNHASLFLGYDNVNGGNYWDEGLELGRISSFNAEIVKEGGDTVIISDKCRWFRPGALSQIKDTRKITITAPSATIRQIYVEITMEMLMDVHIGKTNHSLFSARMASELSVLNGGTMITAEGDTEDRINTRC